MKRSRGRYRRGFWTLGLVMTGLAIATGLAVMWSRISLQALQDVERLRAGEQAMELARSALAEAYFNLQRAVNDPGEALFGTMRSAPGAGVALPFPPLVYTWDLPGAQRCTIEVTGRVQTSRSHSPWPHNTSGTLRIQVRVATPEGSVRGLEETRAYRVQRVSLPPPMHRWVLGPPAGGPLQLFGAEPGSAAHVVAPLERIHKSAEGRATMEAITEPAFWRGAAAFEVSPASDEGALQAWLERRLGVATAGARPGRVNGVVFVDNQGQPAQKVSDLTFRGKAVLVLTGAVVVERIAVENRAEDLLSMICYDAVRAGGRLDLSIVRLIHPAQFGAEMAPSFGTVEMCGSLLDLTGVDTQDFRGSLTANTHAGVGGDGIVDPSHMVVLISPIRRMGPITRR